MRAVLISDTHNFEAEVVLPTGDLLIHAGDFTNMGSLPELTRFAKWLDKVTPFYPLGVCCIAGNHDMALDPYKNPDYYLLAQALLTSIPNVHYLNDSEVVINFEDKDWHIWGSPVTPAFCNWGFNRNRGRDIKKHWDLIPNNVNILITHGPPKGYRDSGLGCKDLLNAIEEKSELRLHVFGHFHNPYGVSKIDNTYFVNAALCEIVDNVRYALKNQPIVVNL